jgi:hypothetical protein
LRPADAVTFTSTTARAGEVYVLEERAAHGLLRRDLAALGPATGRRSHHRHADFAHHRAHVREIDVDEAGVVDHLGDPRHGAVQHVVGGRVGVEQRDVLAEHVDQLVVGDHDQRVDLLGEFLDAGVGDALALAFEAERPRDDGNRENAHRLRNVRDDGRRTGARAAAHAGGDEEHVGAGDHFGDAVAVLHRRVAADLGLGARAEAARERGPELQLRTRGRALERLRVGVGADELHAREPAVDHVLDGIAAAAADADDLDDRSVFVGLVDDFKHGVCLLSMCANVPTRLQCPDSLPFFL